MDGRLEWQLGGGSDRLRVGIDLTDLTIRPHHEQSAVRDLRDLEPRDAIQDQRIGHEGTARIAVRLHDHWRLGRRRLILSAVRALLAAVVAASRARRLTSQRLATRDVVAVPRIPVAVTVTGARAPHQRRGRHGGQEASGHEAASTLLQVKPLHGTSP